MATKRGKSQARRNQRNTAGLPGWAWMVLGIVLTIVVVLAAPKFLKSNGSDGFFRPKPNPDAQPATASDSDDDAIVPDATSDGGDKAGTDKPKATQYDFYTMLPADEVVMSDAELAATAREEAARQANAQPNADNDTATTANPDAAQPVATTTSPATTTAPDAGNDTPYILQAGAFGASGDAEAVKARIALLGLSARVESATVQDKTVYRVRMGPYATASELTEAKRKLTNGGLPALAIKAK